MKGFVRKAKGPTNGHWRRVVLTERWWPEDLVVPRPSILPLEAEPVRENSDWSQRFMYYLFRHPRGTIYYFRVWRNDGGETNTATQRDCVEISPHEAEQLIILQEVNQTLTEDARRSRGRSHH